jgi:hypothetical protein
VYHFTDKCNQEHFFHGAIKPDVPSLQSSPYKRQVMERRNAEFTFQLKFLLCGKRTNIIVNTVGLPNACIPQLQYNELAFIRATSGAAVFMRCLLTSVTLDTLLLLSKLFFAMEQRSVHLNGLLCQVR